MHYENIMLGCAPLRASEGRVGWVSGEEWTRDNAHSNKILRSELLLFVYQVAFTPHFVISWAATTLSLGT